VTTSTLAPPCTTCGKPNSTARRGYTKCEACRTYYRSLSGDKAPQLTDAQMAALKGLTGTVQSAATRWQTIPVTVLDVKMSYGKPLYFVQHRADPSTRLWVRNITFTP
jgi:hypothetical protein